MDVKRFATILAGVVLIAFGVGIYSLRYNDNIGPLSIDGKSFFNVKSNDSNVRIGWDGIDVKDGDDHVQVGWDGIKVKDGNEEVNVGWDGVKIKEGSDVKFDLFNFDSWFAFGNRSLKTVDISEQKNVEVAGIENINVGSSFIDVKVTSEDRDDIYINYHGRLRSNVIPTLEVNKIGNRLDIELKSNRNSYSVTESDVVLEVSLPKSFIGNIGTVSSSGDIFMKNTNGDKFSITASSGDIRLEDLESETINITTSSGDMYLDNISGDVFYITSSSGNVSFSSLDTNKTYVETSSGNITTKDSIGDFNLSSSSGDMTLYNLSNYDNYELSTNSGDVEINLPDNSDYTIKGSSSSGRYTPSRNMDVRVNNQGDFEAITGSGEKSINITTSSGDVWFR
ncbi:MAG: DUF4097 domain-containing protein [Tissierella sp.]|nr:DUF4097 domain-containing protein [Tissierella sp.]